MAASEVSLSGNNDGGLIGSLKMEHEMGDNHVPINLSSCGQELDLCVINEFGQLMGEYSRLDDELWLAKPVDDEAMEEEDDGVGLNATSNLQHGCIVQPEPPVECVDDSVSDKGRMSAKNNSSSSLSEVKTSSPVSVLQKRSYPSVTTRATKRARSKRRRRAKENYRRGSVSLGTISSATKGQNSVSENYVESLHLDEMTDLFQPKRVKTRKVSDLLQLDSEERTQNTNIEIIPKQKQQMEAVKKCLHCESTKTLKWREGPMGPSTLCNACGIQHKYVGLFPDYSLLKSRAFDSFQLSKLPKIHQMRKPDMTDKPQTDRDMDQDCIPNAKSVSERTAKTSDLLQSGCRVRKREPSPKPITKPKLPTESVKKCLHCESTNTPQWREGPMGRNTLCNACGVQYSKGRLFPEYRPSKSPTYDPFLHSHLTKNDIDMDQHCAPNAKSVSKMTAKTSGFLQSRFRDRKHNPRPKPITKTKLPMKPDKKKCLHCESTNTPQWREGPMGRNTLCNACGVQYRNGRLFPEYRPLKSPTYDPSLHSHLPKQVQQMRSKKLSGNCTNSGECEQSA